MILAVTFPAPLLLSPSWTPSALLSVLLFNPVLEGSREVVEVAVAVELHHTTLGPGGGAVTVITCVDAPG